jgi:NADP-dependent alcohol dehydrogenase
MLPLHGLVDAFVHTCEQYLTYLKGLHKLAQEWENRKTPLWQENLMLLANQALNGFIGSGVPQDWATHMIGHEITAFYGLDHAQSLATVQPHLLRVMIEDKKEKLTQMGKEVFDMPHNYEMVIEAIEYMYQSIGVPTKLSAYKTDDKVIENITKALEAHGMSALVEKENLTLYKVSQI